MARRDETREKVEMRIVDVCDDFEKYARSFDALTPFDRPWQLDYHRRTIAIRRAAPSMREAAADETFARSLYDTLAAWGMNQRGAELVEFTTFRERLQQAAEMLAPFESMRIGGVDGPRMSSELSRVLSTVRFSESLNWVVSGTKTIHHLLPDLVPPMDRAYTRPFFYWHMPQFQNNASGFFNDAFPQFARIAQQAKVEALVTGEGWRTSAPKLIDNAIVAFVRDRKVPDLAG